MTKLPTVHQVINDYYKNKKVVVYKVTGPGWNRYRFTPTPDQLKIPSYIYTQEVGTVVDCSLFVSDSYSNEIEMFVTVDVDTFRTVIDTSIDTALQLAE